MSFFSWGYQHGKQNDLPTDGGDEATASPHSAAHDDDIDDNHSPPPLSATGPPPTSLGYNSPSTTTQQGNSPAIFYQQQHSSPTAADSNLHVFVPQQRQLYPQQQQVDNDDWDDGDWVETSPINETTPSQEHQETMENSGALSTDEEPTMSSNDHYSYYQQPQQHVLDQQHQQIFPTAAAMTVEGPTTAPVETEEWEEIDDDENNSDDVATGPATLETVPVIEESQSSKQTTTPGEFEWVQSPSPVEESQELVVSGKPDAAKQPSTEAATTLQVVPRGLPTFTQGVQTGLSQLQEKSARRKHEVRTRIHAVECQMAQWTAHLANERMDRQQALRDVLATSVYQPAGVLVERVSKAREEALARINRMDDKGQEDDDEDDDTTRDQPRWRTVEARLTALETQMASSAHALAKQRREKLVSLHDRLIYDLIPRLWQHRTEAAAQRGFLLERVDRLAAACAARSLEVYAARHVAVQTTDEYLHSSGESYEERHQAMAQSLEEIRGELKREREERQQQDERIRRQMNSMTAALREAMLEAVGDPED